MATELPDGAAVTAVTENRPDSDVDPSLTGVRVEVCSAGLSAEHHRVVATDIAIAARDAAEGGDRIWRLSVVSWKALDGAEYPEREREPLRRGLLDVHLGSRCRSAPRGHLGREWRLSSGGEL